MGQQQLLLIILGVIVVGIAVAVGITMFSDSAINANRDALSNDLVNLASRAQQFYRRPTSLGGGGNSFSSSDDHCHHAADEQAVERERHVLDHGWRSRQRNFGIPRDQGHRERTLQRFTRGSARGGLCGSRQHVHEELRMSRHKAPCELTQGAFPYPERSGKWAVSSCFSSQSGW
jgi:hypothetical protein